MSKKSAAFLAVFITVLAILAGTEPVPMAFAGAASAREPISVIMEKGFEFSIYPDDTAAITKYTGNNESPEIPSSVNGCPVTEIARAAFSGCDVRRLEIPAGIKTIGEQAFAYCYQLKSITVREGTESIGDFAFYHCEALEDVYLPGGLIRIGKGAFSSCRYLMSLTVPATAAEIGEGAFAVCGFRDETVILRTSLDYDPVPPILLTVSAGSNAERYCIDYHLHYETYVQGTTGGERGSGAAAAGDILRFGHYPQTSAGDDASPIEWLVLDVRGSQALLISRYGLDVEPFNTTGASVDWEASTLRTWLNNGFMQSAFSKDEQGAILTSMTDNSESQGNTVWGRSGGKNTLDKIFLLSCAEAENYFQISGSRSKAAAEPTAWAIRNKAKTDGGSPASVSWWLRSPGIMNGYTAVIDPGGSLSCVLDTSAGVCIRPAFWIDLMSDTLCGNKNGVLYGHDWQAADCTHPRACTRCGRTEGSPLGHQWREADCEHAKTCARCGQTEGSPLGHQWRNADCEHAKTCTRCGQTEGSPLGHDWREATYESPKTCARCGKTDGGPLSPVKESVSVSVGDTILFGHYPKTSAGTDNAPIEWIVMDVQGNRALLLSRELLDTQPYNKKRTHVTWETCTLRSWLNSDFTAAAFSAEELEAILAVQVDNSPAQCNPGFDGRGGNATEDRIFLLSYAEAWRYFPNDSARICTVTDYAAERGAWTHSAYMLNGRYIGSWWLRSPGSYQDGAADIGSTGNCENYGVNSDFVCVRPAFWLDLDKNR